MTSLINALPGALSQGLIWGIMAIGLFITYKILELSDLTVDGTVIQQGALIQDAVSIVQIPTDAFSGTLAMLDTRGNEAPRYDGLGDRWQLCYWTADEDRPRNLVPEFDGPLAEA